MTTIDPRNELNPEPEYLELPPAHHREGWNWVFSLVIAVIAMFFLTLAMIAFGADGMTTAVVAPVVFLLTVFLVHSVAGRAR